MTMTKIGNSILCCPSCKASLETLSLDGGSPACPACNKPVEILEGIPILVKERAKIDAIIEEAKALGRGRWFESPQLPTWSGPYRHHLRKRQAYVEGVIGGYAKSRDGSLTGLDMGCGDGSNLKWLAKYFGTMYASDYNLVRLLRAAQIDPKVDVFMADITDYPAAPDSFDVIFFNHVLEHIPDDRAALSEANRILKPGGMLVLGVPNEGALFWQLAYRLQPESKAQSDHVHCYTGEDISAKCREAGFIIQQIRYIGWGVPHWGWDERLRGRKWVDDLFEAVGKRILRSQATSLYLILTKQKSNARIPAIQNQEA